MSQPQPAGRCWELRVHGVGNTPPESVLRTVGDAPVDAVDPPAMVRVSGDEITGFYRYAVDPAPADGVTVEAFSWGQLTSGIRRGKAIRNLRRSGWTLLLPFALVNVALWCRPQVPYDPDERGVSAVLAWLVRAMALGLTCTLMLAAAGVSMDLATWQCGFGCPAQPLPLLDSLAFRPGPRRALVGTVLPLAVLAAIYWLAGKSYRYEAESSIRHASVDDARSADGGPAPGPPPTRLEHPDFWRGTAQIRAQRLVHTGVGVAVVAHALAACVWVTGTQPQLSQRMALAASWFAAAAIAAGLVTLGLRPIRQRGGPPVGRWQRAALRVPAVLSVPAVGLAVAAAVGTRQGPPGTAMPGLDGTMRGLYLAMLAVLVAIVALCWWQAARTGRVGRRADSSAWRGLAAPLFAGAGWTVAMLYSVAALFGTREALELGGSAPKQPRFATTMEWTAVGALAAAGIVLVVVVVAGVHLARLRSEEIRGLRGSLDPQQRVYRRARAVGGSRGVHRFVGYHALSHVGWLAVLVAPVIAVVAVIAAGRRVGAANTPAKPPALTLFGLPTGLPDRPGEPWLSLGSGFAALVFIGLVSLALVTYRYPTVRRSIGVVWDIVTFWPRGAHPFAPPSYAERAVPQLVTRIEAMPAQSLILSGHSQGSLLCAATVAQLGASRRQLTFLLTYGTQLTRLYGRGFPAFFGVQGRQRLAVLLGGDPDPGTPEGAAGPFRGARWRSLYRTTDVLGWPVAGTQHRRDPASAQESDPLGRVVDVPVTDPADLDPATAGMLPAGSGENPDPPIHSHSNYPLSPEYLAVRAEAIRRLLDPSTP